MGQTATCGFPASFGHLWPYRPVVKTKGMTKVFVYTILSSFLQTCSFPPFTLSKLSLSFFVHFAFLPCFSHCHSLWDGIIFMSPVCVLVSRTSMSPIPKSNYLVWEKNLIMALKMLVPHERNKHLICFIHIFLFLLIFVFIAHTWEINSTDYLKTEPCINSTHWRSVI